MPDQTIESPVTHTLEANIQETQRRLLEAKESGAVDLTIVRQYGMLAHFDAKTRCGIISGNQAQEERNFPDLVITPKGIVRVKKHDGTNTPTGLTTEDLAPIAAFVRQTDHYPIIPISLTNHAVVDIDEINLNDPVAVKELDEYLQALSSELLT